jgi:hypothetical protein
MQPPTAFKRPEPHGSAFFVPHQDSEGNCLNLLTRQVLTGLTYTWVLSW